MVKEKIEQIIDRNTEGNYLLSSTNKAQMVSEIMDLVGVADSLLADFLNVGAMSSSGLRVINFQI